MDDILKISAQQFYRPEKFILNDMSTRTYVWLEKKQEILWLAKISVADPDLNPDPSDTYVLGAPGSGSFYLQAKIVRKTLIPTVLWLLFDFLSLKNDVNVLSKSNKQKTYSMDPQHWQRVLGKLTLSSSCSTKMPGRESKTQNRL